MPARDASADQETLRQTTLVPMPVTAFDVVVAKGADAGKSARIDSAAGKILLGTAPVCELRLGDPTVSRRHAAVEMSDRGLLVTDLGSTNGTFVNEARVAVAYLGERDRLRLGSTVLQVTAFTGEPQRSGAVRAFGRMASVNPRMLSVFSVCERLSRTDVSIVVEGETGTGKERLAECSHEASARRDGPFVVLDCPTTPRGLIETHLFGEVRGTMQLGIFEQASGGTLLIDEPADLELEMQAKLLRALDKGVVVPVGDTAPRRVDVRVIVATTRNLDKLVEEGRFREDLYYRLAGARLEIPPLRRRREDIPLLAAELWSDYGGTGLVPDEFFASFEAYDWPGNVRELERAIERFVVLGDHASLVVGRTHRRGPQDAGHETSPPGASEPAVPAPGGDLLQRVLALGLAYPEARRKVLQEFETAYIERALADYGGNVGAAAAGSGIARRYFQRIRSRRR
jgi:two-component system, NtrC family, response regulator HydG